MSTSKCSGASRWSLKLIAGATKFVAWVLGCWIIIVGCQPTHPTAVVSGVVRYQGKPLTHGRVIFQHESGQFGHGDIGPDGTYQLNAPVGLCKVALTCREQPPAKPPPGLLILKSLIPEKYEDHMQSGLQFDVKSGTNTASWDLK